MLRDVRDVFYAYTRKIPRRATDVRAIYFYTHKLETFPPLPAHPASEYSSLAKTQQTENVLDNTVGRRLLSVPRGASKRPLIPVVVVTLATRPAERS